MTKSVNILQRVLVNYFYRVNAGLFIFLFFVLFGLPYSVLAFHLSLITGIVKSPVFLLIVMLLWLMYNGKCADYIVKQLQGPRHFFLFCLNCLSRRQVYLHLLYVQLLVYLPVLLYSVAIVWIAFKNDEYASAFAIIFFHLVVVLATPFVYVLALQNQLVSPLWLSMPSFSLKNRKRFFMFPLYFLLADRKQMLVITKIFSLLLLYGFILLYQPERHDIRPLLLCLLMVAAAHTAIVFELRLFEEEYLEFSKNLPISISNRFLQLVIMYVCLLSPELVLMLKGVNMLFFLSDYPQLVFMLIALLSSFHVVLILENTSMEQMIRIVFGILAACFFVILYNPGILFPIAILALAFALFNSYYYHFEKRHQ